MISVGSEVQVLPGPPVIPAPDTCPSGIMRGHSSAGRAPALQAGGHRFESGWLHAGLQGPGLQGPGLQARLSAGMATTDDGSLAAGQGVSCGKVTRSWWRCSSTRMMPSTLIVFPTILLLVEFVLCQGESGSGASLGACFRSGEYWSRWLVV